MIKIIIPAADIDDAVAVRDRIRDLVLISGETAYIGFGGVVITTANPVRVCTELEADGFDFGQLTLSCKTL
jgi:hypothetical protein